MLIPIRLDDFRPVKIALVISPKVRCARCAFCVRRQNFRTSGESEYCVGGDVNSLVDCSIIVGGGASVAARQEEPTFPFHFVEDDLVNFFVTAGDSRTASRTLNALDAVFPAICIIDRRA